MRQIEGSKFSKQAFESLKKRPFGFRFKIMSELADLKDRVNYSQRGAKGGET